MIIGCGAPDRGDDAAGLLAVRRLRELGVEAREFSGDGAALIELWDGHATVILIDAVVTGRAPGTVTVWNGNDAPVAPDVFRGTHAFGVAQAVQLARVLGRMPPKLWIYGIEASRFDIGSAPSPEVASAAESIARSIAAQPVSPESAP